MLAFWLQAFGAAMTGSTTHPLTFAERHLLRHLVARVRREVPAELVQASLFGSRARGDARSDSDIDILLVFRWLPHDREPHASHAEAIADDLATTSGIPVSVWCVSLPDLRLGVRTPMLVDALRDSIPIWCRCGPLPPVPFTPFDALHCGEALLDRVAEGGEEFLSLIARGDRTAAARRARDDLVRLCTAFLLLGGRTRPRRASAIRAYLASERTRLPLNVAQVLDWAASTFGPSGKDEHAPLTPPPGGLGHLSDVTEWLRNRLITLGQLHAARARHRGAVAAPPALDRGTSLAPG